VNQLIPTKAPLTPNQMAIEYHKCRSNILYFAFNYVYIAEIGGSLQYTSDIVNDKLKRVLKSVIKYNRCIMLASRQLGKSTVAAIVIAWASIFHPGCRSLILNANQKFALENLNKVKFIHEHLPEWMVKVSGSSLKYKAEKKTFMEFSNGSKVDIFYPSAATGPDTIGRSLTASIIYIDEAAFINHMGEAYGSAQPVISKAKIQAQKNGYPHCILVTSTPNGSAGKGQWFFDMYKNGVDSDEVFDENNHFVDNSDDIVNNPNSNGFIVSRYHWSEDSTKDDTWYEEQKRELNFNMRIINQELDLLFLGSTTSIFEDNYLSKLTPHKPISMHKLPHNAYLKLYAPLNPMDFYIVGVDSARSLVGDYCAIEIFEYSTFKQVGEFIGRVGSITKYASMVKEIVDYLEKRIGNRILLAVENNNIGSSLIDILEDSPKKDYMQYMYSPDLKDGNRKFGINTNMRTKDKMISYFCDYIGDDPELISSNNLINELATVERKSNDTISAQKGCHDDAFMAASLCAFVKKLSALEYESQINIDAKTIAKQQNVIATGIFDEQAHMSREKRLEIEQFAESIISSESVFDELDDANEFSPFIM
jgi:hypothetical protein